MVDFNLNDTVWVQLTDFGLAELEREHEVLYGKLGMASYKPPRTNEDGWSKWQLWELMNTFGGVMRIGFELLLRQQSVLMLIPVWRPKMESNQDNQGGSKPTDKDKAVFHMMGIERNYPGYDSQTTNTCGNVALVSEGGLSYRCDNVAIGSCLCANCHEVFLAGYCGELLAKKFHDIVRRQNVMARLKKSEENANNENNNEGKGERK